jgi:hypothetical protein
VNIRHLIDWVGKELNIKSLDDWYEVSLEEISKVAPLTLFRKYGLAHLLIEAYPNHSWDVGKLNNRIGTKASQKFLAKTLSSIFPNSGSI